jgi:hypothetical protein
MDIGSKYKLHFLGLVLFSTLLIAKPVELRFMIDFHYQDILRNCEARAEFYLLGDAGGLGVKRLTLASWVQPTKPFPWGVRQPSISDPYLDFHKQYCHVPVSPYVEAVFREDELVGISLYEDPKKNLWVKRLTLNSRLLNWILWHTKTRDSWCVPSQALKNVGPIPHIFEFDTDELGISYSQSFARPQKFGGDLAGGSAFEVKLKLGQENASDFIRWVRSVSPRN